MIDPITQFEAWFNAARAHPGVADATAMTLATVGEGGKPAARMVLLKAFGAAGFTFYGNMQSRKFRELAATPHAALCFYWPALDRQIRIEGPVTRVADTEADAYFATRERGKQIGAWASLQSQPMASRAEFDARIAQFIQQFGQGPVPRPPHWSGWCLTPEAMEFWSQGESRLHARDVFTRSGADGAWSHTLLYP